MTLAGGTKRLMAPTSNDLPRFAGPDVSGQAGRLHLSPITAPPLQEGEHAPYRPDAVTDRVWGATSGWRRCPAEMRCGRLVVWWDVQWRWSFGVFWGCWGAVLRRDAGEDRGTSASVGEAAPLGSAPSVHAGWPDAPGRRQRRASRGGPTSPPTVSLGWEQIGSSGPPSTALNGAQLLRTARIVSAV